MIQNNKMKVTEGAAMREKASDSSAASTADPQPAASRNISLTGNRLESRELFVGTKEITIGHEGEVYRLRLTALNKLILTK
jgi:hemin uptake protein HemP